MNAGRPRRLLVVARLIAVAALVAAPALDPALVRADPTPSPSTGQQLPVRVTLGALTPIAPQPGQTLTVTGRLRDVSAGPVSDLQLRVLVSHTRVGSRGEFDDYAATVDGPAPVNATAADAHVHLGATTLQAGATTTFRAQLAVDDLHLPDIWQVYEVALSVNGSTTLGNTTVGRLRTFLPWAPVGVPGVGQPTKLAWVWPLVDRPHRTSDGRWTDDALATALQPTGRLGALLAAGSAAENQHPAPVVRPRRRRHPRPAPPRPTITPVPVTWALDPLLVQDAADMSRGYRVATGDGQKPGAGATAAKTWLETLRAAVGRGTLLGLPYGDPDVVAAGRIGLSPDVQVATTIGQDLLHSELGSSPLSYAWPPGGAADQRTLDTLFAEGVTAVVLDARALPIVGGDASETPGAHAVVTTRDGGQLQAVLVDHTLADAVDTGATDPADAASVVQRVLSELLMIQAELPSDQRAIAIAPERRWAPSPALADALLADSGRVPWVQPVSVTDVVTGPVYDKVQRGPVTYPPDLRAQELRRPYLRSVSALKGQVDAFAQILPPGDAHARSFDHGWLRLLSSAWRDDRGGAQAYRAAFHAALDATLGKVHIATHSGSVVTLTSHSGIVPVTVANDLDTPVRIVVGVEADQHLVVRHHGRAARTIPPHRRVPVDIHATARTSGVFSLTLSLYTPNGRRYDPARGSVQLLVRSTAYGIEALLITGAATIALFVGAGIRVIRRARAARRVARAQV